MMNKTPLVSIIVPIYNVENYLEQCVKSIVAQTYQNIEIILVDDGSLDTSGKLADKLSLTDNRIRVIHQKMVEYRLLEIQVLIHVMVSG